MLKHSAITAKKTQHFTVTKINRLTLFKEIIAVCSGSHTKHVYLKYRVIDFEVRLYIHLPLGFKELIVSGDAVHLVRGHTLSKYCDRICEPVYKANFSPSKLSATP
jgi:hypothetical protein